MVYFSPSLMCADLMNFDRDIKLLEKGKVDMLHIDVMDGHFVPNMWFGFEIIHHIRKSASVPLDIHLMIERPERYIERVPFRENDLVSFHIESTNYSYKVINCIKDRGARAGVAINPSTPVSYISDLLDSIDFVLIMTVEPGFSGQKFIEPTYEKIAQLKSVVADRNDDFIIEVDGNISQETARRCIDLGANALVLGSSSVFKKGVDLEKSCIDFRQALE